MYTTVRVKISVPSEHTYKRDFLFKVLHKTCQNFRKYLGWSFATIVDDY